MTKSKMAFVLTPILCFSIFWMGCGNSSPSGESKTMVEEQSISKPNDTGTENIQTAGFSVDFNFETKAVMLNNGYEMPIIGLGTWMLDDEAAENSVYHALKDGYRLIDTARYYGNATGIYNAVTQAIDEGIVTREEIFITTKIVPSGFSDYYATIVGCNDALGLGYIDLMLIHQQGSDEKELYQAIEQAIEDGIVHSLGISNYYTVEDFDRVTDGASILPAVIQNENHPFYQNTELQQYVSQYGIVVESYYSFGGRGNTQDLFNHETIMEIAAAHDKTYAQILLRWQLQAGYIIIPGSSNPHHIAENFNIFDFELSDDEMNRIADMNTGERYEN